MQIYNYFFLIKRLLILNAFLNKRINNNKNNNEEISKNDYNIEKNFKYLKKKSSEVS